MSVCVTHKVFENVEKKARTPMTFKIKSRSNQSCVISCDFGLQRPIIYNNKYITGHRDLLSSIKSFIIHNIPTVMVSLTSKDETLAADVEPLPFVVLGTVLVMLGECEWVLGEAGSVAELLVLLGVDTGLFGGGVVASPW